MAARLKDVAAVAAALAAATVVLLGVAGCYSRPVRERPDQPATAEATSTDRAPSPTPRPTRAPQLTVREPDWRASSWSAPSDSSARPGAPCGVVDSLDFPLSPPNGEDAVVRWAYGRYSRRRGLSHAGEDWVKVGRSSLGEAVFSIGTGEVTHAQSYGWGRDKGTLVIRHVMPDGRVVFSFYGHLDETSLQVGLGDCVSRGQQVATVGQPRTPPHLHFEIRDHMSDRPGPGYWSGDLAAAGWHPPSDFIWRHRVAAAPGIRWLQELDVRIDSIVGDLADGTIVVRSRGALLGLDPSDGARRWESALSAEVYAAVLDEEGDRLYVACRDRRLRALSPSEAGGGLEVDWSYPIPLTGRVTLLPLADGGTAVHSGGWLTALDTRGRPAWRVVGVESLTGFDRLGSGLVIATGEPDPGVYLLDPQSGVRRLSGRSGQPVVSGTEVYVLEEEGVYRCSSLRCAAAPAFKWTASRMPTEELAARPGGGALVAYRTSSDRVLAALGRSLAADWVRSVDELDSSIAPPLVATQGDAVLLVTADGEVLRVAHEHGTAVRLFTAGRPVRSLTRELVATTSAGLLLLGFDHNLLVAFDVSGASGEAAGALE